MIDEVLERLGIRKPYSAFGSVGPGETTGGRRLSSINPANGQVLAECNAAGLAEYEACVSTARKAFQSWRLRPAPARGEVVRQIGDALREHKVDLGRIITLEVGKIRSEAEGEIQEMIDMCDFAVGLSRQLTGLTIASERPGHRLFEQWLPLGPIGIISAFNFPMAVWAWNAMLAAVCGDTMVWKPSERTPLCSIATHAIITRVAASTGGEGVFNLCLGEAADVGEAMIADPRLPLISATGSTRMGRRVGEVVGRRLGRAILELGGNNAMIVTPSAQLDLATRAIVFAAVGTAGQRCTTLRRLIVHETLADSLVNRLAAIYGTLRIGDPSDSETLVGPLISDAAVIQMQDALALAREQGGTVVCGGERLNRPGYFVRPAIVRATPDMQIVGRETFAPILYVLPYRDLEEAIEIHNAVDQGLSSAIFSDKLTETERFLGPAGSDCGIANVNIGTSGAEIGGAFGGEKSTGGGREAGADAWRAYMRRQTCTINGTTNLPLAQGVRFDVVP
jgi:aldehyde dehydrogenase (NAD+)